MDYDFQWTLVYRDWDLLASGLLVTYYVTVLAMALALVLGLVLALMRLAQQRWLSMLAHGYVELLRSLPLYVFLLWIYFGLAFAADIIFEPIQAGVLALGLITAAYMAEIYRAGIQSVDRGQYQAARALGLTTPQIYRDVVLPQAFRTILPAAGNQFVGAFKGAAIVSVIGVEDLMYWAREFSLEFFKPFEFYTVAGVLLIASTLVFAGVVAIIEQRMRQGR